MATASLVIKGMDELQKKLKEFSPKVEKRFKEQVLDSTTQIEMDAIRLAPAMVKTRINKLITDNGLQGRVVVEGNEIFIYMEFGTGRDAASYLATQEPEIREAAMKFYVNGQGTLVHTPYLIPAYLKERPNFIEELKRILNEVANA